MPAIYFFIFIYTHTHTRTKTPCKKHVHKVTQIHVPHVLSMMAINFYCWFDASCSPSLLCTSSVHPLLRSLSKMAVTLGNRSSFAIVSLLLYRILKVRVFPVATLRKPSAAPPTPNVRQRFTFWRPCLTNASQVGSFSFICLMVLFLMHRSHMSFFGLFGGQLARGYMTECM